MFISLFVVLNFSPPKISLGVGRAKLGSATVVPLTQPLESWDRCATGVPRLEPSAATRLRTELHRLRSSVYFEHAGPNRAQLFRGRGRLYASRRLTNVRREMPS